MKNIIKVKNLKKKFKLFHTSKDRLLNIIPFINKKFDTHTSLDYINFEVKKGEFVSIIGKNGSGKSTLLKILCGVLQATSGEFKVDGKVVSLLELGTGFDPELTGRENIINSAQTMDFDLKFIISKMEQIEEFSDIQEYFDMPIKTYSSGMYVRLAMSLFLHLEPDLFIIDEALSVGDIFFQQKCFSKIEQMRKDGVTFLFVSHDINTVLNMSDRVLLLNKGKQLHYGDKYEACRLYHAQDIAKSEILDNKTIKVENIESSDSELINKMYSNNCFDFKSTDNKETSHILVCMIEDENHNITTSVNLMKKLVFNILVDIDKNIKNPGLTLIIKDKYNTIITSIHNSIPTGCNIIQQAINFTIQPGQYSIDLRLEDGQTNNTRVNIVNHTNIAVVNVDFDFEKNKIPFYGPTYLENKVEIFKGDSQ